MDGVLDDRRRRWIARGFAVLGLGTVVVAVVLGAFQGVLPPSLRGPVAGAADAVGREGVAWTLALAGTAYGLWRVVRGRREGAVAPEFVTDPPERSSVDVARTGTRYESVVEAAAADVDDPDADGEEVRAALRDLAIDVIRRSGDASRSDAAERLATGEWTDDRVAAAFLGGDDAPGYPFRSRIRGWIRPGAAFEHRSDRAVAAIRERLDRQAPGKGSDRGTTEHRREVSP